MGVSITSVSNISHQVVNLHYTSIPTGLHGSSVPPQNFGRLAVPPGSSISIETSRLDMAQLMGFSARGMINYTNSSGQARV